MRQVDSETQDAARLWTLDYVLNLVVAHCVFAAYTAMFTIIPLYVVHRSGEDIRLTIPMGLATIGLTVPVEMQLGIIIGSFGLIGLLVRPFTGRWVYTFGAKRIAIVGPAALGAATLLHILAVNVWLIIPARVLQGIGLALGPVTTSTIAANLAPARRRGEAMSYMSNSIALATVYSPPLAFLVYQRFGFPAAFIYAGMIAFAGSAVAVSMSAARTNLPTRQDTRGDKVPLINRQALFPMFVFLTYTVTTAPVNTFLPQFALERGFGNPGLYFTVYSITSMISLVFSGRISDRLGRGAMIVPGLLIVACGMFILSTAESRLLFWASGALTGLGFAMIQPSVQSWTVERVPAHERSSALATLQQAWDLGGSLGAFAIGPIGAATGVAATFAIAGAGSVMGAAGFVGGNLRSARKRATPA